MNRTTCAKERTTAHIQLIRGRSTTPHATPAGLIEPVLAGSLPVVGEEPGHGDVERVGKGVRMVAVDGPGADLVTVDGFTVQPCEIAEALLRELLSEAETSEPAPDLVAALHEPGFGMAGHMATLVGSRSKVCTQSGTAVHLGVIVTMPGLRS